jgi:catechol 2,3-dioxygenase-like lactoylglutathione lyase family enzyme
MQQLIEKMVNDFENGKLSRRQLASAIAALASTNASAAPASSDFKAVNVNHVTLRVSNVERSTKFYQEVFGMPMRTASPNLNILALNANCFFAVEAAKDKSPAIDHFSFGVQNFKFDDAMAKLKKRGFRPEVSKESLKFLDPDGIAVQLNAPNYPGYLP